MKIVLLSTIEVRERQRTSIPQPYLNELKESILNTGLLNPPVCWLDEAKMKYILVAGECRLKAISQLANEKKTFRHSDQEIIPGGIPITPLGDYLDAAGRFEAELDENVRRHDLEWPDKMRAYAALHEMRKQQNPTQTLEDTGKELIGKTGVGGRSIIRCDGDIISDAMIISKHLGNEKIAKARNPSEAIQLIRKMEEEKILSIIARREIAALPSKPDIEIRHDDLLTLLPKLDPGTFDLIIADPPYGIEASGAGFRSRSVHHHNYRDDVESARAIAMSILEYGFRIAKIRATIFIFCDIDLFPFLKTSAANMGWTVFRRPLVWLKSESEGLAPWGGQGPRITTEFIFYATKGQRGLNASPLDVFNEKRLPRQERLHA